MYKYLTIIILNLFLFVVNLSVTYNNHIILVVNFPLCLGVATTCSMFTREQSQHNYIGQVNNVIEL